MLGNEIRRAREAKGFSQRDLAARAGVSRKHLSDFENGANVSVEVVGKVARALGLKEVKLGGLRIVESGGETDIDLRFLREAASRISNEAQKLLRHVQGESTSGEGLRPAASLPQAEDRAEVERPVRIYLVEEDKEHTKWRAELKDFASRSDEVEYRTGVHTPAKYRVPVRGTAAAGHGADIQPVDEEDQRQIPDHYWEEKGARDVLRIRGNSLKGRGIVDHDLVYIKPLNGDEPRQRNIVVAEVDDKIVVKVWKKVKGQPFLFSANPKYPNPIDPSKLAHFAVKGVVVGRSGYGLPDDED